MKISILSFSIKGCILSDKIEVYLEEEGHSVFAYALEKFAAVAGKIPFQRLEVVTARIFYETDVIILLVPVRLQFEPLHHFYGARLWIRQSLYWMKRERM